MSEPVFWTRCPEGKPCCDNKWCNYLVCACHDDTLMLEGVGWVVAWPQDCPECERETALDASGNCPNPRCDGGRVWPQGWRPLYWCHNLDGDIEIEPEVHGDYVRGVFVPLEEP